MSTPEETLSDLSCDLCYGCQGPPPKEGTPEKEFDGFPWLSISGIRNREWA